MISVSYAPGAPGSSSTDLIWRMAELRQFVFLNFLLTILMMPGMMTTPGKAGRKRRLTWID
jgi:hypothetical protein